MYRPASTAKLQLENLEQKNLMAGDVAVHVVDGTMVIVGDPEANGVQLSSTEVDGQFVITGIEAGGETTTINGETTPLVVEGVERSVRVRMGDGDDRLHAPHLNVDGAMVVRMGRGDDVVRIGEAEADEAVVDIARGLYVALGSGNDVASIAHADARWIRVNGGTGDDAITVRNTNTARSLRIHSGAGDDEVHVGNARTRNLAIRTGAGDDSVRVANSRTRRLFAHLGNGDDQLAVAETEARRAVLLGGRGTDALATDRIFESSFIRGFENV